MEKYNGQERRTGKLRERIIKILNEVLEGKRTFGQEKMSYALHAVLGGGQVIEYRKMFRALDGLLREFIQEGYTPFVKLVHKIHFEACADRENPDFKDQRNRY